MRRTFLLVFLVACNVEDDDPTKKDLPSRSGARLELLSWEMADGSRLVRGFYDSQLQEDCDIRRHADGTLRCFPTLAYSLTTYFRNDGCVGDLVAVTPKEFAPRSKFAVQTEGDRVRVFRVGSATSTAYQGTPQTCAAVTFGDDQTAYVLSSEAASSDFVEAVDTRNR